MMLGKQKQLVSIVVPVFNEENNIQIFYEAAKKELVKLSERFDYEFIFTDNCSSDNTFPFLKKLAKQDSRVRAVRFSKNFGYQRSILTGYTIASGNCAIQMDVDLQDPPELIPQLIAKWEEGFKVVYGIRRTRKEGWVITATRQIYYRLINFLSEEHLPHDAGDFRLIDRKVLDKLKTLYDANPYLRGTIASLGFKQIGIPYDRAERHQGNSKFNLTGYLLLAIDGIANHSVLPLRFATFIGFMISGSLILYFLGLIVLQFFFKMEWPRGFATISILILLGISLNALFLGVIGEYLGRIYQQVKKPPITIIDESVNLEDSKA